MTSRATAFPMLLAGRLKMPTAECATVQSDTAVRGPPWDGWVPAFAMTSGRGASSLGTGWVKRCDLSRPRGPTHDYDAVPAGSDDLTPADVRLANRVERAEVAGIGGRGDRRRRPWRISRRGDALGRLFAASGSSAGVPVRYGLGRAA